jgi:uncharacterized iron-regulated membrane protein
MSNTLRFRRIWFQIHKWIGIALAILIIPISITGAALVWHDALNDLLNPQRVVAAAPTLQPSQYAAAARSVAAPGENLVSLVYPGGGEGPVVAALAKPVKGPGRPVRTMVYLHPTDARVIERTASNTGLIHVMHVLHGSLMIPGMGRQIVGWIGVAMLLSSLTGLWLWWPLKGGLRRGLRWKRQPETSGNLHHQGGFWIAIPLAVLSFTGAWISFPAFFANFSGDPAPPSAAERARRLAAAPLAETRLTPELALTSATSTANGKLATIAWPTSSQPSWTVTLQGKGVRADVKVDDSTGKATPPPPAKPETVARLMRRIHDGTGMGIVWQVIIFLGGLIPAALAVTGIMMWLNMRGRRRSMELRRRSA